MLAATDAADGSSASWQKPSTLVIIVGLSITVALLIGGSIVSQRLANHARFIKVLDEIEMEFVNDNLDEVDEEDFVEGSIG